MLSKEEQNEIIRKTYRLIYDYCLLRLKNKEAALDVTQDTFLLMVEKAARLQNDSMKSWLLRVAENKCNAYIRKIVRELGHLRLDNQEPDVLNRIFLKLDDRSFGVYYETYQSIMLNHLSVKEAYLCELRFIKGMSPAEIAKLLHIKEAAVNTRVSRLKKKIVKVIDEDIPFI